MKMELLIFAFFSQQRLDSKKENGRVTKVKEDEGKVFLLTSKQRPNKKTLSFTTQMLVLYNELKNCSSQVKNEQYNI